MLGKILAMLACIVLSGYFSATETAFSAANKTRLKALSEKGNKRAGLALSLAENYDCLISTILIGNNIVNIALASIGTLVFLALCGQAYGATVSTVVITVAVLIFGEITPKSVAKDHPEGFAMFSAPFINLLIKVLSPLNFLFSQWKRLVAKLFGASDEAKMTQEELLLLLEEVEHDGAIDESEGELLRNAVNFGELEVQDILTHRVDLEAVSKDATHEEIAAKFTESRFSRLLVYEDTIDKIVGVIHQKDFYQGMGVTDKPLAEIMTPPVFIHQTVKVDHLLDILQTTKSHLTIVVDEYGGTLGIVTMEDILEELVGEIWDEHDEVAEPFREVGERTFEVDCSVSLTDFCEYFDVETDSDSVSFGGFIMEKMECIPSEGDRFVFGKLTITVKKLDEHRIEVATVEVAEPTSEDAETEE